VANTGESEGLPRGVHSLERISGEEDRGKGVDGGRGAEGLKARFPLQSRLLPHVL